MPEKQQPSPAVLARPPAGASVEVTAAPEVPSRPAVDLVDADLLVEDVSIDGMCGVY